MNVFNFEDNLSHHMQIREQYSFVVISKQFYTCIFLIYNRRLINFHLIDGFYPKKHHLPYITAMSFMYPVIELPNFGTLSFPDCQSLYIHSAYHARVGWRWSQCYRYQVFSGLNCTCQLQRYSTNRCASVDKHFWSWSRLKYICLTNNFATVNNIKLIAYM